MKKREYNNLGKLPPMALDLEEAVLGSILIESTAMMFVADVLRPEMFYKESHQLIYKAAQEVSMSGDPLDLMTVMQQLRRNGDFETVGGAFYLTGLSDRVVSSVNIEYHSRIIAQKFMQRELIRLSSTTINDCYDETKDIFDILSTYETERDNVVNNVSSRKEVSQKKAVREVLEDMARKAEMGVKDVTGVDTGDSTLNSLTGGWQQSDLIILAARPAMGKTAFALKKAVNAARAGNPVAVFSLEMSYQQLIQRVLSFESGIALEKIKKLKLQDHDWHKLSMMQGEIEDLPIHWDDTPGLSLIELSAKAKRLKRQHGVKMIIIDYLQLITTQSKDRYNAVSDISRALKVLAKELDIPVIALSQLSRAVESRPGNGKRPMLSDLRESGSIEQDADMVMFLYRPEYYGNVEDEEGRSTAGMAEAIVAKHRNGSTDTVLYNFQGATTNFTSWDDDGFISPEMITDFSFIKQPMELPSNNVNKHAKWNFPEDNVF
ncbi:replicative DNA helicase [Sphingobacterium sp. UT-1RO-CII-1]|uniref:replicative DNA helicase n=1 Tax=Sphingobacterium sp. UT-1RO-CII-1 TaxID=2995225 RepID=UPI00227D2D6D|nr:replicative DNA helicase [Sphingobacterium sp. UT-1RO-CII-1]MCY4781428.1 replicative DNA helicase [Sphingobacterium sp. UT-1RO-CII-1]